MPKSRFRTLIRWTFRILVIPVIMVSIFLINLIWFRPFSLNHFYERVFIEFALEDPELLSRLRILEPMGLRFHNDDLTDVSPEQSHRLLAIAKRNLEMLQEYDRAEQSPEQRLSTDILAWFIGLQVKGESYMFHDYPVNQLSGIQNNFPTFMETTHQINDAHDAEQYITRLTRFALKVEQTLEGLRIREEKGIIPPQFVIDRVLDEMTGFIEKEPEANILYTAFSEHIAKVKDVDTSPYLERVQLTIQDSVYPAYDKLISYFTELRDKSTTDDGVWKFPDGDAYYQYALMSHTTTSLTAEEIHQIGLDEVARIQKEMGDILSGLGHDSGSVGERMGALSHKAEFLYPDSEDARQQCLDDYQIILDEIDKKISRFFGLRPESGVEVRRIPEFKEQGAPAAYYDFPALDGSRPGVFYANLRDMAEIPKYRMRTLAYHEGIPGHHFQIAIQQQIEGPSFRRMPMFTAYIEGWALYAEQLAWEQGFHEDPYSNLGRLQDELFRGVRLVVDTGIHKKRWTREQAIEYVEANTGMPHGDVVTEIERYIVDPGQACAYKIGQLKILELRDKANEELGDDFELKAFHDVILGDGALPLELLEQVVDEYIESAKSIPNV